MNTILTIGEEKGILFEGTQPGSLVFVPVACITYSSSGKPRVDALAYIQSGWDVKNMRFNTGETSGNRLFPNTNKLVNNIRETAPIRFIERLQRSHAGVSP